MPSPHPARRIEPDPLPRTAAASRGAFSDSTERARRADLAVFRAWCAARGAADLPTEPGTLAAFVDDMAAARAPAAGRPPPWSAATANGFSPGAARRPSSPGCRGGSEGRDARRPAVPWRGPPTACRPDRTRPLGWSCGKIVAPALNSSALCRTTRGCTAVRSIARRTVRRPPIRRARVIGTGNRASLPAG